MIYEIKPIAEDHIPSFRETLEAVDQEQKFLSLLEAPPLEQMRHFVLNNIKEWACCRSIEVKGSAANLCSVRLTRLSHLASPASS
jgi:hypothetical protein